MKPNGCKVDDIVMLGTYARMMGEAAKNLSPNAQYRVKDAKWDCSSEQLCDSCHHEEGDCVDCNDAIWWVLANGVWCDAGDLVLVSGDANGILILSNTSRNLCQILEEIRERTGNAPLVDELRREFGPVPIGTTPKMTVAQFSEIIYRLVEGIYPAKTEDFDMLVAIIVEAFQEIGPNDRLLQPLMPW